MTDQNKENKAKKSRPETEEEEFVEVVPVEEEGDREGEAYLLEEEGPIDKIAADERSEDIVEQQKTFAEDEDIAESFEERQELSHGGRKELEEDLEEHHFTSPDMTGGDIDADWEDADTGSGAEAVGGTEPTPDQDVVDELGEAVGITYEDDEPLNIEKKMREMRDSRLEPPEEENTSRQEAPSRQEEKDNEEEE